MNKVILLTSLLLMAPVSALAGSCPTLVHEIDEILAEKPDLDEETIVDEDLNKNVRELRNDGEALHKAGKHAESVAILQKALALLKSER